MEREPDVLPDDEELDLLGDSDDDIDGSIEELLAEHLEEERQPD